MSLNVLQSGLSKAAIVLSALTACSAPRAQKIEEPGIHLSEAQVQRQSIRQRIISALQETGYHNSEVKRLAENVNENTPLADLDKVERCFMEDNRIKRFMAVNNALAVVSEGVDPELKKCMVEEGPQSELDTKTIGCMADAVIAGGIGEKFAVLAEEINATADEIIYCLEKIPSRK